MKKGQITAHVIAPIILGAAVYTLWRTPTLLVFGWYKVAGLTSAVELLRAKAAFLLPHIPSWVLLSLPDGLWVYAVTACMASVWGGAPGSITKYIWLSSGLLLGAGGELGQVAGFVPGTYDTTDLVVCVTSAAAALAACRLTLQVSQRRSFRP